MTDSEKELEALREENADLRVEIERRDAMILELEARVTGIEVKMGDMLRRMSEMKWR